MESHVSSPRQRSVRAGWSAIALLSCLLLAGGAPGCSALSYIDYRIAPDYPRDEDQTVELGGLQQPVLVFIDQAGVAHIDARSQADLVRAVGYVQARSRFFAMDMMRRFARGRLSELVGEQPVMSGTTVEFDLTMRGWGFDDQAAADAAGLDPATRQLLEGYVDGINRALALHEPLEYRLLEVEPEPWSLADCFALGRLNAWSVSHNWHQETSRLLLALHLGVDRAAAIYGHDFWRGATSLPPLGPAKELPPAVAPELREVFPPRPHQPKGRRAARGKRAAGVEAALARLGAASNGWVLAGERSASGMPIVANDPHMAHLLPSIMFQQHLRAPGIDVIGGTLAGLPFVLSGHNRHVAWSTTSAVADAIDLVVERANPDNPKEYDSGSGYLPFTEERHVVRIRDGSDFDERAFVIRRTKHGPLLNDMMPGMLPDWAPPVAVRWETGGLAGSIRSFWQANQARSVQAFRAALAEVRTPAQTWMAADRRGAISLFATGTVPVRPKHRGTFPMPGWLPAYEWTGSVEPGELPGAVGSPKGYFAHGNNLMSDPEHSPILFQIDSAPSYRLDRIVELIEARPKHDWRSMAVMQRDVHLKRAERLLPHMLADLKASAGWTPVERQALELLDRWDGNAPADSAAAAVFFMTYREAVIGALRDELDERGFEFVLSQRYSTNVADLWFDRADHVVWDDRGTEAVEGRATQLEAAFRRAVTLLSKAQGSSPGSWQWGRLHDQHSKHLFGSQESIADFVNLPASPAGGGLDSIWKSHFDLGHPKTPFRAMAGPVYRMIVDLADMDHGHWIVDTGASGWPGSPHYGDQHEPWRRGAYLPMISSWPEIRAQAAAVLTLKAPAPAE